MGNKPKAPATKADVMALHGAIERRFDRVDRELRHVNEKLDAHDERFNHVDGQLRVTNEGMSSLLLAVDALENPHRAVR